MAKKGGPTIDQLAKKCKTAFEKLQEDLESMAGDDAVAIRDEKARFNIWIDTVMPQEFFGISRLDYQLRDSESLRTKVKSLLEKLNDVLEQARGPDVEEVDSAPSDEEVVDDLAGQRSSGQARQIRRARRLVDMLLRLSGSLKHPAPDDLIKSGALSSSGLNHDSDIEKVRTQFPGISDFLAERLGKAISKRRQYFIFKANYEDFEIHSTERERSRKEYIETERRAREILPNESTEKKHLERIEDIEEPAVSNGLLSVESLDAHAKSKHLQSIEPAPGDEIELAVSTDLLPGARVKCPLCSESFRPDDQSFWDAHLEDDLSAYLCTWEHCPVGRHMYRHLGDWQRHENTAHRQIWKCPFECDVISETSFEFVEHVKANHEVSEDPEVLKSLVEACSRPAEPAEDLHCPMCESAIATYEAWYRHVGAHVKCLSYFSLPAHLVRVKTQADGKQAPNESVTDGPPVDDDDEVVENSSDARPVHGTGRHATVESDETEVVGSYSDVEELESVGRLENITIEELPVEESKEPAEDIEIRETVVRRSSIRERSESPALSIRVEKHPSRSPSRERVVRIFERGERWDPERFNRRRVFLRESSEEEIVRRYEEPSSRVDRDRYSYQEWDLPAMQEVVITREGDARGRDAKGRQRSGTREEYAKHDKEKQYEEFVRQYERQQAMKQMEKLEMEARFQREFEEKQARKAEERAEAEEKIKMEMKMREEQKKHKEEQDEKKLDEKMRKRLATFGFTDHQIRSIMNQDEPDKQGRGFERNDRPWEREREYYAPSRDYHAPVRDDYSPVREEYIPDREYRTRSRRAPAPPPARPSPFEPDEYQEPIRFEDAEYRRYKLPWKVAKTWKGMQKVVREIYQNSETRDMDEDVIGGRYQIIDADDNGILPSSWELTVKPGHVYKLAFTRPPGGRRDDENPFRRAGDDIVEVVEEPALPRRSRSPTIFRESARDAPTELILERRNDTPHRRKSRRAPNNKAVSWDPYIEDETGWYPSLESATRGGFRRPGKEPEQQNLSYAYPQSSNTTARTRRAPTYVKVHRGHVAPETLRYYDLPWEYDHSDPNHIIILQDMDPRETDILFEHTRRLREGSAPLVTAGPSSRGKNLAMVDTLGVRPQ